MRVRAATLADSDHVLAWRNDAHTIAMSGTASAVEPDAHERWFALSLKNRDRKIYIGELDGVPFGMVRFDQVEDVQLVSINLAPNARGSGLSAPLLRKCMEREEGPFIAEVRRENEASLRLFAKCGFEEVDRSDDLYHLKRG